jgi:ribosomal protein S18 acetylase RimI-like enzyme
MVDINLKNDIVRISNARPEQLDEVCLVLRAAFQQYENFIPSGVWQSYLEDILDVRSRLAEAELIVAVLNKQIVGTVTLYSNVSRILKASWPKGWAGIRLLAVDPRCRRQGIGRALMDECVRRCRGQGIVTIGLHTTEIMDVARRMYERMGFTPVPEFDFHPAPGVVVTAYRLDL